MMMEKRTANCPQDKVSVASVEMVKEAVQSLSKGKLNLKGFQTDHLIYAPMICYILLSFLFTSILVHGNPPDDMLGSTIVPIPKNVKFNILSERKL